MDELSSRFVKVNMRYKKIPESEKWKVPILKELLETKFGKVPLPDLEQNELNEMIKLIAT